MAEKARKGRTVLVKCLVVDSDGFPVNRGGGPVYKTSQHFYKWDKRYRSNAWLEKYPHLWKEIDRAR